jgi:hypothetical protein
MPTPLLFAWVAARPEAKALDARVDQAIKQYEFGLWIPLIALTGAVIWRSVLTVSQMPDREIYDLIQPDEPAAKTPEPAREFDPDDKSPW